MPSDAELIAVQLRARPAVVAAGALLIKLLKEPASGHPAFVVQLWRGTKAPATAMTANAWRALFVRAGYSHNGIPAKRPDAPVALYRGATEAGRFGMAWTTERRIAERFAGKPGGQLWTATVEPKHLLAYISDPRDPEHECVVDPAGLTGYNVCRDGETPPPRPPASQPVTAGMLWEARQLIRQSEAIQRRARRDSNRR